MSGLIQDLQLFGRQVRRQPVWTAAVVACLGLGIAANTAMWSSFEAWVLRPLPYRAPEELTVIDATQPRTGLIDAPLSAADLRDWRERQRSFVGSGAFSREVFDLEDEEAPARIDGARIEADLLPLLGVEPAVGRSFLPGEDLPGAPAAVALIGDRIWRERFGASPEVLGETLRLDGRQHEIVGVMPEGFGFPEWGEIWVPLGLDPTGPPRDQRWLTVVGRLGSGVGHQAAAAEARSIGRELERLFPETNRGWSLGVRPLKELWAPPVIDVAVTASMGAGMLVLLVVCSNVASLLLARTSSREREMAVRWALGAGRGRIVRQLMVESLVLALVSGIVGLGVGKLLTDWMLGLAPVEPPYQFMPRLDAGGLLYTLLVVLVTGLLCALAPALRTADLDRFGTLRGAGGGGSRRSAHLRGALVVGELALSTALVIGALLMVRSFLGQQQLDLGYRSEGLLTMEIWLGGSSFEEPAERVAYLDRLQEALRSSAGVAAVGVASLLPASPAYAPRRLEAEGVSVEAGEETRASLYSIGEGYLETLELPLLHGRGFTARELLGEERDVALVSAGLARSLWGEEGAAVGRRLRRVAGEPGPWLTVVGVVGDVSVGRDMVSTSRPDLQVYRPYGAAASSRVDLVVAGDLPPAELAELLRRRARQAGALPPTSEILTMEEVVKRSQWVTRLFSKLLVVYGVLALAIAGLGIYGLMADAVGQRRREMAVRVAVGAGPGDVARLVLGQGMLLATLGLLLGLALGAAGSHAGAAMLVETSPRDPLVFGGVALLLVATSLLASYLPARRAAAVDPAAVLKSE